MVSEFSNINLSEASIGEIIQKIFSIIPLPEACRLKIQIKLLDAVLILSEKFQKTAADLYTKILSLKKMLNIDLLYKSLNEEKICADPACFLRKTLSIDLILEEPLKYYLELVVNLENLKYNREKGCDKCFKKFYKKLNNIRKKLEQTILVKEYLKLPYEIKVKPLHQIYERIISFEIIPASGPPKQSMLHQLHNPEECYNIGPYKIIIYPPDADSTEYLYTAHSFLPEKDSTPLLKLFRNHIKNLNYFSHKAEDYYPLDQLIEIRRKQADSFIKTISLRLPLKYEEKLVEYLAYQTTPLNFLTPYLLDDEIEEVFIDSPRSKIYLDHRRFGRCNTTHLVSKSDFDKMVTYLRAVTGLRLDVKNPSLKTELLTKLFHVRLSIDVPPLAVDGFHVDIRKLRRRYFSLTELIGNNTLTAESAAYLYFCMLRKRNILVLGRPGDGKTTLLNALDSLTPSFWRKITVEDVIESICQNEERHQTRFQVEPLESNSKRISKAKEIVKLLHRSPDYLLISEIQTEEDSNALFHALSAGLSGLFTCHGNSVEDLLLRWNVHHKIPVISFYELDLLVHIKKFDLHRIPVRRVVKIAELSTPLSLLFSNTTLEIREIFAWSVGDEKLVSKSDLYETSIIEKIKYYEQLSREQFYNEFNTYHTIFELLARKKVYSIRENAIIFGKLYSLIHRMKQTEGEVDWDNVLLWFQKEVEH